jgi:alkanesulfonate monooxygenase SsuD/methylene tetrahydromethanopterin reductase-like flavin-dependent oxidoreductase (luciferase family)
MDRGRAARSTGSRSRAPASRTRTTFVAVWTPERHFQAFGGLYPNLPSSGPRSPPVTSRVGIRAGSVALPLHNPCASPRNGRVVDNLSNGRVAVSFASGWHPDDFVLYPSPYAERKEVMLRGIETIRRLWAGEHVTMEGPNGPVEVRTLPRPVQKTLPVWVTTAGSGETWEKAGTIGANVLAALVGYEPEDLTAQIARYRARARAGRPRPGRRHRHARRAHVRRRRTTRGPRAHAGAHDGLTCRRICGSSGRRAARDRRRGALGARCARGRGARVRALLRDVHAARDGRQDRARRRSVAACGRDEMACLVDFGLATETVLEALPRLARDRAALRRRQDGCRRRRLPAGQTAVAAHGGLETRESTDGRMRDGAAARAAAPDGGSD